MEINAPTNRECYEWKLKLTPSILGNSTLIINQVNSLRSSDAYMHCWTGSSLVQIMACRLSAPSHYLNRCWSIVNIVNWTFRNKLKWNFNRNSNIFIQEIEFENVCKMASILSQPQWVNAITADVWLLDHHANKLQQPWYLSWTTSKFWSSLRIQGLQIPVGGSPLKNHTKMKKKKW